MSYPDDGIYMHLECGLPLNQMSRAQESEKLAICSFENSTSRQRASMITILALMV